MESQSLQASTISTGLRLATDTEQLLVKGKVVWPEIEQRLQEMERRLAVLEQTLLVQAAQAD